MNKIQEPIINSKVTQFFVILLISVLIISMNPIYENFSTNAYLITMMTISLLIIVLLYLYFSKILFFESKK